MPQPSKTRRPYQPTAAYEVATSNSTVNAFIGGRQPSWMSNATPVKPTPRPKPVRQHFQQVPSQASATVLPSPAPSDEPSPAVSNVQDSPNPQSAVLPDHRAQDLSSMDPRATGRMPVTEARFVHEAQLDQVDSRQYGANFPVNSNLINRPTQIVENQQNAPAGAPPPLVSSGRLVHPMASLQSPQMRNTSQSTPSTTVWPSNVQSPSLGTTSSQVWNTLPQGPAAAEPSAKRRKISNPTSNAVKLGDLAVQLDSYAGQHSLTDIERARIQILRDACGKIDTFYLTFHQLFCLWSVNKLENSTEIYTYVSSHPNVADAGFKIMETVLKGNDNISTMNLRYFAEFPCPIGTLLGFPSYYQTAAPRVTAFLQSLPERWPALVNESFKRGYPYLVDELLKRIPCPSIVLQTILFTASRRRLCVRDGPLGIEIDQLFRRDQAARMTPNGDFIDVPYDLYGQDWQSVNDSLISGYKRIVQMFRPTESTRQISGGQPSPTWNSGPSPYLSPQGPPEQQQQIIRQQQQELRRKEEYWMRQAMAQQNQAQSINHGPYQPRMAGTPGFVASPTVMSPGFAHNPSVQQSDLFPLNQYPRVPGSLVLQSSQGETSPSLTSPMSISHGSPQPQRETNVYQYQNAQNAQFNTQYQVYAGHPGQGSPTFAMPGATAVPWTTMAPQNGTFQTTPVVSSPRPPYTGQAFPMVQPHMQTSTRQATQQPVPATVSTGNQGQLLPPRGFEIPRNEHASSPNDRKSLMMSLHQADVLSPARVRRGGENSQERYYQAVKGLVMPPVRLDPDLYLQNLEFEISEADFALFCRPRKISGSVVPASEYFNGSLRYRLRCCKLNAVQTGIAESDWVTLDVSWPKSIWMKLNDQALTVRRKPHNGKDLPIELTLLLKPGKNLLRIAASLPKAQKGSHYFIAIDVVQCLSHSKTVENIWRRGALKMEDTLEKIRSRLQAAPSDDDIEIANQDLKITLADPWSFSIFTTPVRGVNCTHLECFDLENWLQTRPPSKPSSKCSHGDNAGCKCLKAKEPSHADKWKCPICDKDARPDSLRIDSFLLNVRRRLEQEGKLGVKAILVAPNCQWRPEIDPTDDDDDSSDDERDGKRVTAVPRRTSSMLIGKPQNAEVIELLDDD